MKEKIKQDIAADLAYLEMIHDIANALAASAAISILISIAIQNFYIACLFLFVGAILALTIKEAIKDRKKKLAYLIAEERTQAIR